MKKYTKPFMLMTSFEDVEVLTTSELIKGGTEYGELVDNNSFFN